jgi:hypothetical protein
MAHDYDSDDSNETEEGPWSSTARKDDGSPYVGYSA